MASNVDVLRKAHEAFSRGDQESASQLVSEQVRFVDHGRQMTANN